jgi:hypothetical protein
MSEEPENTLEEEEVPPTDPENLPLVEESFGQGINKKVLLVTKGVTLKNLHLMSK